MSKWLVGFVLCICLNIQPAIEGCLFRALGPQLLPTVEVLLLPLTHTIVNVS